MINRDERIEGVFKSWLAGLDTSVMAPIRLSYAVAAAIELARATGDQEYVEFALKVAEQFKKTVEAGELDEGNLANMKLGLVLYYAYDKTGDKSYEETIKKLASLLNSQSRSEDGVFVNQGSDAVRKEVCVCQAYLSQVFYMKYESTYGGKERYNDIIAQYNTYRANYYDAAVAGMKNEAANAKVVALFAAALIDTMEVMDQPMYEIFRRMRDFFKESVADMISAGVFTNADAAAVIAAYDVLKGCRMKALHTEKYEAMALKVLKAATAEVEASGISEDMSYMAALAMCYGESLKNREYQDYGRGKGGALWS